jgi:transposase-like protein
MRYAKKPPLTDEQKQRAIELFHENYGVGSIASFLKASHSKVGAWLKENGLHRTPQEAKAVFRPKLIRAKYHG